MKKITKITLLMILIILTIAGIVIAAQDIISDVDFSFTSQKTTVTWHTDIETNSTFIYEKDDLQKKLSNWQKNTNHEYIFDTRPGDNYNYKIISCTELLRPECAERTGQFTVTEFFLDLELPKAVKTTRINIEGLTNPGTTIKVTVNDIERKRITTKEELFKIYNIPLDKTENKVKIEAFSSGGDVIKKEFDVIVDTKSPELKINIPELTTTKTISLKGNVDEECEILVTIVSGNQTKQVNKTAQGNFTISLDLFDGKNTITVTAKDKMEYTTRVVKEIVYDTGPPQFLETNLEQITPSYKRAVTIRGKLNEKASVTVFLNGKPEKTVLSDDDGTFAVQIVLKTIGVEMQTGETGGTIKAGAGFSNIVKLQAVDAAGLTAETKEHKIEYAVCGYGSWFQTKTSQPVPEILTPRLLLEGIQQTGVGFEIEYKGDRDIRIRTNAIKAKTMILSPSVEKQYDNGWVHINTIAMPVRGKENKIKGYIQFNYDPIDLLKDKEKSTTTDKLNALSDYRRKECAIPGFGCAKFMLELEIPFQEITKKWAIDPYTRERIQEEVSDNKVQKICIEQEIAIDQAVRADIIPKGVLKFTVDVLKGMTEGIDTVLGVLEPVGKVTTIGCVAGPILLYILDVQKKLSCELSAASGILTGKGFDPAVAKSGLCEIYSDSQVKSSCESCTSAVETYNDVKNVYQQVCDRIACPDAPTLQTFIKRQRGLVETLKKVPKTAGITYRIGTENLLYQGSDCAAWLKQEKPNIKGKLLITNDDVKKIYSDYKKHQEDGEKTDKTGINCAGLHPATPECCGYEYMQTWGSACGVSGIEFLDTFDEIKESACLSAERFGLNEIKLEGGKKEECNKLWNSIAGFCEPTGGPITETRKVIKFSDEKIKEYGLTEFSPEQMLYIFAIPLTDEKRKTSGITTGELYSVKLGYVIEVLDFKKSDKTGTIATAQRHYLSPRLEAVELETGGDLKGFFKEDIIENYYKTGKIKDIKEFQKALCTAAGKVSTCITSSKATELYEDLLNIIGTDDTEYVVKPASGLLRSAQCVCLPGMVGHLKKWKGILTAAKNCLQLVETTGEGSEGMCQAGLETNLCEFIFDAIKCFSERYSTPKESGRIQLEGAENFLTAITSAGSDVERDIEQRYGGTTLFKSMFVDRKLVHSICAFAFTGTWSLDPDALFDMSIADIPIGSTAAIYPCERRFIGYDPASYPVKGAGKWLYHFGVMLAAGSDVDVKLKLKCSQGYKCKPKDGFLNGECDCRQGEKILELTPPELAGKVSKYDVLSKEIFIPLSGDQSLVRYDTAELIWSWTDREGKPKQDSATCRIGQSGMPPPAFCSFDMFTLSFKCVFGEQETGIRFRGLEISAPHVVKEGETEHKFFVIDDKLNATLAITQDYPSPPKPVYNKFLSWYIQDAGGKIVLQKDPSTDEYIGKSILKTQGDYSVQTLRDLEPIVIEKKWLEEAGVKRTIFEWNEGETGKVVSKILPASDIKITRNNVEYKAPLAYILEIDQKDGKWVYKFHKAKDATGTVRPEHGFEIGTTDNIIRDLTSTIKIITTNDKDEGVTIEINLPTLSSFLKSGTNFKRKEFLITQTVTGDICTIDPTKPHQFKITFEAYDADEYGAPTTIKSLDTSTGASAKIEKKFYVVCKLAEEVKLEELKKEPEGVIAAKIENLLLQIFEKTQEESNTISNIAKSIETRNYQELANSAYVSVTQYLTDMKTLLDQIEKLKPAVKEIQRKELESIFTTEFKGYIEELKNRAEKIKILEGGFTGVSQNIKNLNFDEILETVNEARNRFFGMIFVHEHIALLEEGIKNELSLSKTALNSREKIVNEESKFLRKLDDNIKLLPDVTVGKLPKDKKQLKEIWEENIKQFNTKLTEYAGLVEYEYLGWKEEYNRRTLEEFTKIKKSLLAEINKLLNEYGEYFIESKTGEVARILETDEIKELRTLADSTKLQIEIILKYLQKLQINEKIDWKEFLPGTAYYELISSLVGYIEHQEHVNEVLIKGFFFEEMENLREINRNAEESVDGFKKYLGDILKKLTKGVLDKALQMLYAIEKNNLFYFEKNDFEYIKSDLPSEFQISLDLEIGDYVLFNIVTHEQTFIEKNDEKGLYRFNKYTKDLKEIAQEKENKIAKEKTRKLLKSMIDDKFNHLVHPDMSYEKGKKLET